MDSLRITVVVFPLLWCLVVDTTIAYDQKSTATRRRSIIRFPLSIDGYLMLHDQGFVNCPDGQCRPLFRGFDSRCGEETNHFDYNIPRSKPTTLSAPTKHNDYIENDVLTTVNRLMENVDDNKWKKWAQQIYTQL